MKFSINDQEIGRGGDNKIENVCDVGKITGESNLINLIGISTGPIASDLTSRIAPPTSILELQLKENGLLTWSGKKLGLIGLVEV